MNFIKLKDVKFDNPKIVLASHQKTETLFKGRYKGEAVVLKEFPIGGNESIAAFRDEINLLKYVLYLVIYCI